MVMQNSPTAAPDIQFTARSIDDLLTEIQGRYGDNAREVLARLDAKAGSVADQNAIVEELHKAGLNGQAEALLRAYREHKRELDIKADVSDRWYHKAGRMLKSTVLAPFKAVGWAFKNYPVTSTVATVALIGTLAYFFGVPIASWVGMGADSRVVERIGEVIKPLVPTNPLDIPPGIGPTGMPPIIGDGYPSIPPPMNLPGSN